MKTIGLLGGMSYVSTLAYYKIIHEAYLRRFGTHHSPHLILVSVDFHKIATAMHNARWDVIEAILTEAARTLKKAGADFGIICCNSAHNVFLEVQRHVPELPLVHILDVIGQKLHKKGIQHVGIVGTRFVMDDSGYKTYLQNQFTITSISPDLTDQMVIQHIIYQELCLGIIKESAIEKMHTIVKKLRRNGAEAILLGCTELLLIVSPQDYCIPIIDSTTLHAEYTVEYANL